MFNDSLIFLYFSRTQTCATSTPEVHSNTENTYYVAISNVKIIIDDTKYPTVTGVDEVISKLKTDV